MKTAVIQISEAGSATAFAIELELHAKHLQRTEIGKAWKLYDAFIFVGALGICVRTIAAYVNDKHTDPAVVCVDTFGKEVISVLSGHVGGANELTQCIARILGGRAIITTQSDNSGLWALDTFEQRFNWPIASDLWGDDMNRIIFAFVNKQPTALLLEARDEGTDYLESTLPEHVTIVNDMSEVTAAKYKLVIIVSPFQRYAPEGVLELHFVPMVATIGFGLAHQAEPAEVIYDEIDEAFADRGILPCAKQYCTIDMKANEPFIEVLEENDEEVRFFSAEELSKVESLIQAVL